MAEVDSKLASEFIQSPNRNKGRRYPLTRVTIHHTATVTTARVTAEGFTIPSRKASATYCIGDDGSIVQCVAEADSPWTSGSWDNDNRAITIEVSNSKRKKPWPIGEKAMESLIALLVDICQRNPGIGRLNYTGDTSGNMTMHKWFASTQCPGEYLAGKFGDIAKEVNARLDKAAKKTTTVYDLQAAGLPETLANSVAAEIKNAGYTAALTAREVKQDQPVTPTEPDGYHSIVGKAVATAEQMVAYIKGKRPDVEQSVIDMIPLYLTEGKAEGIAGDIAFAQSCVETGLFAFPQETCAVKLSQNNFAMMGVTSTFAQGESFATPQIGIRAQIQHLKAYANAEALKGVCVDPRFKLVTRGSAPYVEWLGQPDNPQGKGWATAKGYGARILAVLAEIRRTKATEDKPAEDNPADDTLAVGDLVTMQGGAPVYGRNREFASWVYSKQLYVRAIVGDRITVSIYKSGAITGNVHRKYLKKV